METINKVQITSCKGEIIMSKKYELVESSKIILKNVILYRIKALIDIPNIVKAGELGGYIESEKNLSHEGNCWVADDAFVYSNAYVSGDAKVYGDAQVSGNAKVFGNAFVYGNAKVYGDAFVYDDAHVYGESSVCGRAKIQGKSEIYGIARIESNMTICDGNIDSNDKIVYLEIDGDPKTFHVSRDNTIVVSCREINYFREIVRQAYDEPIAKAYLMMCDLAELKLSDKLK